MLIFAFLPDIYDYVREGDITSYTRELSSWSGTLTDIDHSNTIRCHAFLMESGTCLRTNTVPLYMEANRQVIFFSFCALHLEIIIGRLDYNLSLESEWKSLMVPQCSSSLFFVIMAFGSYMLCGKS